MTRFDEEELAALIAVLAPAPFAWRRAAVEFPRARAAAADLIAQASAKRADTELALAELEAALRAAGVKPYPRLVERLLAALSAPGQ